MAALEGVEARLGLAEPILEATVPCCTSDFSLSLSLFLSECGGSTVAPPALRSGLDCRLESFLFGLKAPFNLPTGEGERL